jgi:plastocyanin
MRATSLLVLLFAFVSVAFAAVNTVHGGVSNNPKWIVQQFFPQNITVRVRDQILFVPGGFEHTMTFGPMQDLIVNQDTLEFNAAVFPLNGPAVTDPTVTYSSGIVEPGENYTFIFEAEGTFTFFCLLHPFMVGQVTVVAENAPADSVPAPADVEATAQAQLKAIFDLQPIMEKENNLTTQVAPSTQLPGGNTQFLVGVGFGNMSVWSSYVRFHPANVTVMQGDVIVFQSQDFTMHTVNFNISGEYDDDNTVGNSTTVQGAQTLFGNPNYYKQTGNPVWSGGFVSSGILNPGETFNVTFQVPPGTYRYICSFHDELGMIGFITVTAAATTGATGTTGAGATSSVSTAVSTAAAVTGTTINPLTTVGTTEGGTGTGTTSVAAVSTATAALVAAALLLLVVC